jgi:hypothetical protein
MVGANPTPVAWGETPSAIKQGVADALDPSVGALYVFGFKDILSHVTFTQAVPDSQVYSMNLEWFNSCRPTFRRASSSPAKSPHSRTLPRCPLRAAYAMAELAKAGVSNSIPSRTTSLPNGRMPVATSARNGTSSRSSSQVPWTPSAVSKKRPTPWAATTSTTPD